MPLQQLCRSAFDDAFSGVLLCLNLFFVLAHSMFVQRERRLPPRHRDELLRCSSAHLKTVEKEWKKKTTCFTKHVVNVTISPLSLFMLLPSGAPFPLEGHAPPPVGQNCFFTLYISRISFSLIHDQWEKYVSI